MRHGIGMPRDITAAVLKHLPTALAECQHEHWVKDAVRKKDGRPNRSFGRGASKIPRKRQIGGKPYDPCQRFITAEAIMQRNRAPLGKTTDHNL